MSAVPLIIGLLVAAVTICLLLVLRASATDELGVVLFVKPLDAAASLPSYATSGAACFDLATINAGTVPAHGAATFRTGLSFEIPRGHVMLVYSRSGHGFKRGTRLSNCVGVIDSDYRGEVMVRLHNDTAVPFSFEPGDRVAQAMIVALPAVQMVLAADLSDTQRGVGGFGSTGN